MLDQKKLFKISSKYVYGWLLLLFIGIIFVSFSITCTDDFNFAKREVLLLKIGHQLLLQAGDSTSRVLPIEKVAEHEYQIRFEHELSFQPDSLVNSTRSLLAKAPFAVDYIVHVLNCNSSSVVYGFAISENKKEYIIACIGRIQPRACYMININFKPTGIHPAKNSYLLGSLPLLAIIGFIFFRSIKSQKAIDNHHSNERFRLGSALFDSKERQLITNK